MLLTVFPKAKKWVCLETNSNVIIIKALTLKQGILCLRVYKQLICNFYWPWNYNTAQIFVSNVITALKVKVTIQHAAKSHQLCPTLCNPIDGSPTGSSDPGILQARILEWVAIQHTRWKITETLLIKILYSTLWRSEYSSKCCYTPIRTNKESLNMLPNNS